jgi:bifunctional non-homologous end joining protein LigD
MSLDESVVLRLAEREIRITNVDRVLWPEAYFTKGDLVAYYAAVAEVLLPHLRDRPVTTVRAPDGVDGRVWFQTNAHHPPEWVRTAPVSARDGAATYNYAVIDDEASLMWAANLSSIEFHPISFHLTTPETPDHLVFDLDPGEGADLKTCCRAALLLRARLDEMGMTPRVKTSGMEGIHVFVPVDDMSFEAAKPLAREIAQECERSDPSLIVARNDKDLRAGRVFIDWAQNNRMRQTVAPYSVRVATWPFVSTPITWDEVRAGAENKADLRFGPGDVLARLAGGAQPVEWVSARPSGG